MLFIVPCPCAGTSSPASASAANIVSARRCDISTFPAATAAGHFAFTAHPSGASSSIARAMPSFVGTSSSSSVRSTNTAAARVTASGQFTFPRTCGDVPAKSKCSFPSRTLTCTTTGTGSLETPSPSSASSARPTRSPICSIAARARRSV